MYMQFQISMCLFLHPHILYMYTAHAHKRQMLTHVNTSYILSCGMKLDLTKAPSRLPGVPAGKVKRVNICWLTAAFGTKRCCVYTSALDR